MNTKTRARAFKYAILAGIASQVALAFVAHDLPPLRRSIGFANPLLAILPGVVYALVAVTWRSDCAKNGFILGSIAGLAGILTSVALGDLVITVAFLGWIPAGLAGALGGAMAGSSDLR